MPALQGLLSKPSQDQQVAAKAREAAGLRPLGAGLKDLTAAGWDEDLNEVFLADLLLKLSKEELRAGFSADPHTKYE